MKVLMAEFSEIENDRRILKEASSIEKMGFSILIIGFTKKYSELRKLNYSKNIKIIALPHRDINPTGLLRKILRAIFQLITILRIWREILLVSKIDIYHAHNALILPIFALKSKINNKILIYDVHEVWWEMEDQLINPEGFLENRFINYPDYIFTYSEKFIPYLQKKYRLDTSIYPLPNYPSTDDLKNRIDKLTFIPSYKFPNNYRLKVVFAGRIIPNSGLYSFIQVMRYFENIELHVYGYHSQNSRKRINNIIYKYKLDDRVYFHDPVASANILKELQKYDVGIILYKKGNKTINYKTFSSTKLYMYFHAGLPVICTKVESYLKDFEKYNFMYWVDWDNIISLKNSIRKIYKESNESFLHKKNECLNVSNKMIWECNEGILRQVYNEFGIKTANERK